MTFSVIVKHKKEKKKNLHIDLTYSFTKAIKHIHTLLFVVQSSIQVQQKETETNSYIFNRMSV